MAYRETSTKIIFNMEDETAKEDAAFDYTHSPIKNGCDIEKLKTGGKSDKYMTNELNYSILNSSKNDLSSFNDYAFVSDFSSNGVCEFESEYYLRIIFNDSHTTNGITITFDSDFLPDKIRVVYYDSTLTNHKILNSIEFTVDEYKFFCNSGTSVNNFKEIRIYFISTKYPYSLIKINKIEYGASYIWSDGGNKNASIVNAEIFEETDIISNTLSIGTFRFTIYSDDDDFNIDNPKNIYQSIKKNQKVEVYETIKKFDDNSNIISIDEIFMGQYYLKEWKTESKHTITFECVDLIGVIDDITFDNSSSEDSNSFGFLISSIIESINMGNNIIEVPNEIFDKNIIGILPLCTCREALQMACFAIGGYATCSRRRNIYVSIKNNSISHNILDENNLGVITSSLNTLVTGVKYPSISYIPDFYSEVSVICEQNMKIGTNQIILIDNMVLSGLPINTFIDTENSTAEGELVEPGKYAHKIIVNITKAGKLVIKGYPSILNKKIFIEKEPNLNVNDNIIDISNIPIYESKSDSNDDIAIIDKLLNYYSKRNYCEYEFILNKEETGNWCLFKNMYGDIIKGNLFSMSIDLTGGFLAKAKLVCCENLYYLNYLYVCGNELTSGENIGII